MKKPYTYTTVVWVGITLLLLCMQTDYISKFISCRPLSKMFEDPSKRLSTHLWPFYSTAEEVGLQAGR